MLAETRKVRVKTLKTLTGALRLRDSYIFRNLRINYAKELVNTH